MRSFGELQHSVSELRAHQAMARPPRVEDAGMVGGVASQRMEATFNALSARLMHQDHYSRLYHGGSPGAPSRVDPARSFRSDSAAGIVDGQPYGTLEREHFLAGSVREFNSSNSGVLPSVEKTDGLVDEVQRFGNGGSHISSVVNTSPRVLDWTGSEQPGELGSEAEYREMEDGDGGSSGGSQSEGSEEDEDDEGDIDGEGEDMEPPHQGVTRLVDPRLSSQRSNETTPGMQSEGMEGSRQDMMAGVQISEGLQKTSFDRELSSHASTSSTPSVGMFLSPSSTIPFLNSFSSPASAGSNLGQSDSNPAAPNGTLVVASGLGGASHGSFRDGTVKEAGLKDAHEKDRHNHNQEQSRNVQSSPVPEAVPIGSATAQCYSSLVQATAVTSQKDQGNQIVAFSHRKSHEPMEMPLRSALTDPLTGAYMDDATILLCGHSFGRESLQRVLENNACISCGAAARREDMAPNHALQLVVQAYRREEQRWKENASRAAKRRRERLEQDRQNSGGELTALDFSRYKGVQFPYKVNDRVLIKGNKRTPERFVGRNAIITTQCLNGWYVVRTLDSGETVKLQYRSLTKADEQVAELQYHSLSKTDEQVTATKELQTSITAPNWL